jgi:hypothetical protein
MARTVSDDHDIQGIIRSGYGSLEEAAFLLLRITDAAAAKAWLGAVAAEPGAATLPYRVTRAGDLDTHQEHALQVAFTAPGLKRLGVPAALFRDDTTGGFAREFRLGMAGDEADAEGRSRRLGDVGRNAPSRWDWGGGRQRRPMSWSCSTPRRADLPRSSSR